MIRGFDLRAALASGLVHLLALVVVIVSSLIPTPPRASASAEPSVFTVLPPPLPESIKRAEPASLLPYGFEEQPWPRCRDRSLARLPQLIRGDDERLDIPVEKPTMLCVQVGTDGRIHDAWVLESSGNAAVDRHARSLAIERLEFIPAQRGRRRVTSPTWLRVDGNIKYYAPID